MPRSATENLTGHSDAAIKKWIQKRSALPDRNLAAKPYRRSQPTSNNTKKQGTLIIKVELTVSKFNM